MIQITDVHKSYGQKQVLEAVTLSFGPGVHGLLGPNGAGKTTLLRCILQLVVYQGEIKVEGGPQQAGYLPQQYRMMEELTAEEALQYVAILKGVSTSFVAPALEQTHLAKEKKKKVKHLSGGMLRRLGVAQALLGDANVLLLDEPTAGLDPKERVHLRNLIEELGRTRCVLLSTHIVEDVAHIGETIAVLDHGKVLVHRQKEALLEDMKGTIGELTIPAQELGHLEETMQVLQVRTEGEQVQCRVFQDPLPDTVRPIDASLEDIYLALLKNE